MTVPSTRTIKVVSAAVAVLLLALVLLSPDRHDSTGDLVLASDGSAAVASNAPGAGAGLTGVTDELPVAQAQADEVLDRLEALASSDAFGLIGQDELAPLDYLSLTEAQPALLAMALPSNASASSGNGQPLWGGPFGRQASGGALVGGGGGSGGGGGGGGLAGGSAAPSSTGGGGSGGGSLVSNGPVGGGPLAGATPAGVGGPEGGPNEFGEWIPRFPTGGSPPAGPLALVEQTVPTVVGVPEPSTLALAGIGSIVAAFVGRRRASRR